MQQVYLMGDVHLSASQPWRLEVGEGLLSWISQLEVDPTSEIILLGDYTDEAVNPGKVVDQLHRLVELLRSKFSHVYMLVGNHDYKLYKNKPQLSFEFVDRYEDITILSDPAEILTIAGLKVLSLPHFNYRDDLPPMFDYYSNLPQEILQQQFDLTIGHFADKQVPMFGHTADLSDIQTQVLCLGDIHTRIGSHYIGSCFATKVSEYEKTPALPRGLWVLQKQGSSVKKDHIPIPDFCTYETVEYPEPLPETATQYPVVYTITNVVGEQNARNLYGNIYIRSTSFGKASGAAQAAQGADEQFLDTDPLVIFDQWMKETETPISRSVSSMIRKMLAPEEPVAEETIISS